MTPSLWIGLGFTAALIMFLIVAFLKQDTSSANQHNILRFLTALCSGFAGGFLIGDALFRFDQQMPNGVKLGMSGTAGFALFFAIWFTFGKWKQPQSLNELTTDEFRVSIPEGWTFEQAVRVIVRAARANVDFEGFQLQQLQVRMRPSDVSGSDARDALMKLFYSAHTRLPKYRVDFEGGIFHIRRQE